MRKFINIVEALDMSPEARMQRAKEQGYDIEDPHYHGTPHGDIEEFDHERTADEDLAYGAGVYASKDPAAASGYSNPGSSWGNKTDDAAPTVYKVFMKVKNPFDLDKTYPFAEIKRIFHHCFTEDEREHIKFWQKILQERYDYSSHYDEIHELEERLFHLPYEDHSDYIDPEDYEDGEMDTDYLADLENFIDTEEKSVRRRIESLKRMDRENKERHERAVESGRTACAAGKDIYRTLWQNTDGYHDWKAERKLFGGDTGSFEFKTEANRWLQELGYDGITHTDHYNPGNRGKSHKVTIAFNPNQVRSVHADFDPAKANSPKLSERRASVL